MASYSQFGQDLFVLRVLGFLRGGYFLDSGASNGVDSNNTYLLERDFDWKGLCVEPNSDFFEALVRNRKARCVNCCLYDHAEDVQFVEAGTLGGVLADYHPALLALARRSYELPIDQDGHPVTVSKPTRTILSLLRECKAPRVIDYWSLDTEGSELRLLKSFPFELYRVRVLTIEHNRYPVRLEIHQFLTEHGYVLARDFGIDDAYVEGHLAREGFSLQPRFRRRGRINCRRR